MARLHYAGRNAHARNCTQRLGATPLWANYHISVTILTSAQNLIRTKLRLKSAGRRRMVLAATCRAARPRKTGAARRQVVPPCSLCGRPRGKRCYFELVLRQMPKEQMDRLQFKRT